MFNIGNERGWFDEDKKATRWWTLLLAPSQHRRNEKGRASDELTWPNTKNAKSLNSTSRNRDKQGKT